MTTYAIYRIIGNSLPPRHLKSDNLRSVAYILAHEPSFPDSRRSWILNRLVDLEEKAAIQKLLTEAGEDYVDLPFDAKGHYEVFLDATGLPASKRNWGAISAKAPGDAMVLEWLIRHKSQKLVGINEARNHALMLGRSASLWTLVLDGGVIIPPAGWSHFIEKTNAAPEARFAVVALSREYDWDAVGTHAKPNGREEPQLAFHRDSSEVFDERLRYGNRNKAELLVRLGVEGPWHEWKPASWDVVQPLDAPNRGRFVHAGFTVRLPSGGENRTADNAATRYLRRYRGVAQRSLDADRAFAQLRRRPEREFTFDTRKVAPPDVALEHFVTGLLGERDRYITDKEASAPSGNPRDYFTLAPYWSADGRFHDGVVQELRPDDDRQSSRYDRASLLQFTRRVYGLSFGGRLLGRRDMLAKAGDLLRAWFIASETRMTPSARYAQMIPGRTGPSDTGIIEFREFAFLPFAIVLLLEEGALKTSEVETIRSWFKSFLRDSDRSGVLTRSLLRPNNIATWASALFGAVALFSNDFDRALEMARWSSARLGIQLGALSDQPHELERTRPLHYCLFNLSAWLAVCRVTGQLGIEPMRFEGVQGESLKRAAEYCADNRHRFPDYAGAQAGFDRWIDILLFQMNPERDGGGLYITETADWGLPPLVLPLQG